MNFPRDYQDQASTSAKWEHTHTNTHTHCFHLCLSSDCVSQCLGRKIGLCRAQREPKGRLSKSAPAVCASPCQPSLKLFQTPFSQSHQPTLDWWLSLSPLWCLECRSLPSVFALSHLGSFALFTSLFHAVLFVCVDVCNTSLVVCCSDWFFHDETWVVFSGVQQSWNQNISFFFSKIFFWIPNVFAFPEKAHVCNIY